MKRLPSFTKVRLDYTLFWEFNKKLKRYKIKLKTLEKYSKDLKGKKDLSVIAEINLNNIRIKDCKERIEEQKYNLRLIKNYYFKKQTVSLG